MDEKLKKKLENKIRELEKLQDHELTEIVNIDKFCWSKGEVVMTTKEDK